MKRQRLNSIACKTGSACSNSLMPRALLTGCATLALGLSAASAQQPREGRLPQRNQVLNAQSTVRDVPIAPNVEQDGSAGGGDIPFSISVDGQPLVESKQPEGKAGATKQTTGQKQSADMQRETDVGMNAVDIQVKFDGLDVQPMLNISTIPVRRAYKAGEQIVFLATANYPAFIEHSEIRIFAEEDDKKAKLITTIPVKINGQAGWVMPAMQPLTGNAEPRYTYVLRVYDSKGRYDETLPRSLVRTSRDLKPEQEVPFEGVAPGMGDDFTALRNIPVQGGAVTVYGRNVPDGYQVRVLNDTIPIDTNRAFVMQRILPSGDHDVDVAVINGLKGSALDFKRQINIPQNDWFYVALADLTVGKRSGDKNIQLVRSGEYDEVYTKGRLAFYLKGKIQGKYLLTAAGDTGEDKIGNMFRGMDAKDPRQLLRRLDPDDFYPVYGDDSTTIDDAPTNGKLYVRLERGDSHVMWGNYKTIIKGTEFMRSERALYGASAVYRSEDTTPFGERRSEVTLYAAQPDTLPQRDEFLATGGSVYFMRRQDITVGSESVTIEIRDPITGQVQERRTLRIGDDYSFDYLQGLLLLKRPLSSSTGTSDPVRESALGGNKVYLIAQYEYTPPVGEIDGYVYGGRAQQWLNDKIRIGVTGMSENTGPANQQAYGADIAIRHSEKTFIEGEFSRSEGPGFGMSRSADGGLTLSDVNTTGRRDRAAMAWRTKAQLDLEDLTASGLKGTAGIYYQEKQAGFSTLAEQIAADQRSWGAYADIDVTDKVNLDLIYDDFTEDQAYSDIDNQRIGGRTKRKGTVAISKQLNEYWKMSFGVSYMELQNPLTSAYKSGYNGSRADAGVRLDYAPDADHLYYLFGQTTVTRSDDISRGDRLGAGTKFRLTDKIDLEGELSYGATGLGGLAAVAYNPTAEDTYYFGYRLDPDRAFDVNRSYDLSGSDRGTFILGARRQFDDYWSGYAENNYDLFGYRRSLTKSYGVVYTPDKVWKFDGGFEEGTVEDDTIDPVTGRERSDFDRKAVSLSVAYKDEDFISGRIRGEARFENSDDGTRDANTYLLAAGLGWKTSNDWRLLAAVDAVLSETTGESSFRGGDYVETSLGYAYRPVSNDRLNALFKYIWLYDQPGGNQVSAITGDEYGPAQRSHILSADFTYDLLPWLSVGAKYGFRYGKVRYRLLGEDRNKFGLWQTSSAHLGVIRTDLHIVKNWDALLEGRVMVMPEAGTTDYGALTAIYRHVGDNFKVGVGYNFGNFSDDLRDLSLNDRGVFLNVVGKF